MTHTKIHNGFQTILLLFSYNMLRLFEYLHTFSLLLTILFSFLFLLISDTFLLFFSPLNVMVYFVVLQVVETNLVAFDCHWILINEVGAMEMIY